MPVKNAASPLSEPVSKLIALFTEHLAELSFPDLNAERLEGLAQELNLQSAREAAALEELEQARAAHSAARKAMREASKRALGYAKVYAEGDQELSARVGEIRLSERKLAPPKRRARAGKKAAAVIRVV